MRLYRAVSQAERDDIAASGVFRQHADSFAFGKWFALNQQNAASWGRWFADRDGLRYYVVETEAVDAEARQLAIIENLDNIGAAVFLMESRLSTLPILFISPALSND